MTRYIKILLGTVLSLLLLLTLGTVYFCPLLDKFPSLPGPYAVGVQTQHLVDTERTDARTHSSNRELVLRIYYPSSSNKCLRPCYDYLPEKLKALKKLKARESYIPSFFWNCFLSGIKSYAEPLAAVSDHKNSYPVILYLPGIGGLNLTSYYLEQLASQGFIVAALEIPFDTELVVFPEGRVATLDPKFKQAITLTNREKIYECRIRAHYDWFADAQFVIKHLEKLTQDDNSPFYTKLNLAKLGVLGHSHGGAVALDLCARDKRFKAGIDMDGWTKTVAIAPGLGTPFLFLLNQEGLRDIANFYGANGSTVYRCCIRGAGHDAFSDLIFLKWPLPRLLGVAFGDTYKVQREISERIAHFLKKELIS